MIVLFLAARLAVCPPLFDEWEHPACNDLNPFNGYWWQGAHWVPGLVRNATWFAITPPVMEGKAVWYAQHVMEATAAARGLSLDGFVDGVSGTTCSDLGLTYWIRGPMGWEGPFLVVDCASRSDLYGVIVHRDEVVEVGWETAYRWGMQTGGWEVVVSKYPPEWADLMTAADLSDWFIERAQYFAPSNLGVIEPRPIYRPPSTWRLDGETWTTFVQPEIPTVP